MIADKIITLLDTLTLASLDALPPARRRQFADRCHHWAKIAEQPPGAAKKEPKSTPVIFQRAAEAARTLTTDPSVGILAQLKDGDRAL